MDIPKLPGRKSLGHQLTSGVNGPGLFIVDESSNTPMKLIRPHINYDEEFQFKLTKVTNDFIKPDINPSIMEKLKPNEKENKEADIIPENNELNNQDQNNEEQVMSIESMFPPNFFETFQPPRVKRDYEFVNYNNHNMEEFFPDHYVFGDLGRNEIYKTPREGHRFVNRNVFNIMSTFTTFNYVFRKYTMVETRMRYLEWIRKETERIMEIQRSKENADSYDQNQNHNAHYLENPQKQVINEYNKPNEKAFAELRDSDFEDESSEDDEYEDYYNDNDTEEVSLDNTSQPYRFLKWQLLAPRLERLDKELFTKVRWDKLTSNKDIHVINQRNNVKRNTLVDNFIPKTILQNIDKDFEIRKLDKQKGNRPNNINIFDLSIGDSICSRLFKTQSLESSKRLNAIAYVIGEDRSHVGVSLINEGPGDKFKFIKGSNFGQNIFDLHSKVKSIKFAAHPYKISPFTEYIAILTGASLHIIKASTQRCKDVLECHLILTIPLTYFSEFPIADITFNPWNEVQVALIDVKGNWFVYQLPYKKDGRLFELKAHNLSLTMLSKGNIYDPEDVYTFKRISWSSSSERLLLVSSNKVIEVDVDERWQRHVVEAVSWSSIWEYKSIEYGLGILLTSKEVIIIDKENGEGIKRLISWKHDLESTERNYKFSTHILEFQDIKLLFVSIYSKNDNMIYGHSFLLQGDNYMSVGEDTVINIVDDLSGIDTISDTHQLFDENFDIHNERVKINIFLQGLNDTKIRQYMLEVSNEADMTETNYNYKGKEDTELYLNLVKPANNVADIALFLFQNISYNPPEGYSEDFDDSTLEGYGYLLSKSLNKLIKSDSDENNTQLIDDIGESSEYFSNLNEFSSLLQQFVEYYQEQDISFTDLRSLFSILLNESIDDMDIFNSKLLQCWELITSNAEYLTNEVVKDLVFNYFRYFKRNKYERRDQKCIESLRKPYMDVLSIWGKTDEELMSDHETGLNSEVDGFGRDSQPIIPMVGSSQKSKTKKRSSTRRNGSKIYRSSQLPQSMNSSVSSIHSSQISSTLPNNMTPAFTLMQRPLLSQTLSSQQSSQDRHSKKPKKKKRKVGGFN